VLIAILLAIGGITSVYVAVGMPPIVGAEDAAIGFRYARNLAQGHGFVFNPGGETVEGVTSLLWAFTSAAVYAVAGPESLETVLFMLSIALTAGTLGIVSWLLFDCVAATPARALGTVWLAAGAGFFFWSGLSLMDVALWAFLLQAFMLALYLQLEGRNSTRGLLAGLVVALVLTRPDAMLIVPAVAVVAGLVFGASPAWRRASLEIISTHLVALIALTAVRLSYFGYPLPNTYYTKVSPDITYRLTQGVTYIGTYVTEHRLALLPLALALAWAGVPAMMRSRRPSILRDRADTRLASFVSGVTVVGFLSIVGVGGDHYQGHRFLQAYLPGLAITLGVGLDTAQRMFATRSTLRHTVLAVAGFWALILIPLEWRAFSRHGLDHQAFAVGLQGQAVGRALGNAFEGETLPEVGLWMAGGAGYAYPGPVKDLLGLNWIAMGHSPGDRKGIRDHAAFNVDVFWSAPPQIMLPEPEAVITQIGCTRTVLGGALRGLLTTRAFEAAFRPIRIRSDDFPPIIAYGRADWLLDLPPSVERLNWIYCRALFSPSSR